MKSIKRVLTTVVMLAMLLTWTTGTFAVSAAAATTCSSELIVVDDNFASMAKGTTVSATVGGVKYTGKMGTTAFANLPEAYAAVKAQGSIYVAAGIYNGDIAIDKIVYIYGNNADVNPNNEEDLSVANSERAITGPNESILQDVVFYYKDIADGEMASGTGSFTLNGFAVTGDSAVYLRGDRLVSAEIDVSNNVFALVNETAYQRIGNSDDSFYVFSAGVAADSNFIATKIAFKDNRVLRVSYAGNGYTTTGGVRTFWGRSMEVTGNYIANTTGDVVAIAQLGEQTIFSNNYLYNGARARVYDGIKGNIEISGNTFDSVGGTTAGGGYTLGVYANADSNNYSNIWNESTSQCLITENTFKNVGNALRMYAKFRAADKANNSSPYGAKVYSNKFLPVDSSNCCFLSYGYGDGLYSMPVYDNYTAGLNPTKVITYDNCVALAKLDLGSYWLNEEMTESSDLLAVKKLLNSNGVVYTGTKIAQPPECAIAASVPYQLNEIKLDLELGEGAYYEFYKDEACTTLLPNNTLSLEIGANTVYAKVHYSDYSAVYTVTLTKKVAYSDYLPHNEYLVGSEFAQYTTGQMVYVELNGEWYRAQVGHSVFGDLATALTNVQNGDTVTLTAGVYANNCYIAKGVTLNGAKAGINPNDMTSDEYGRSEARDNTAEETIISAQLYLQTGCDGLTVDGITMIGGGTGGSTAERGMLNTAALTAANAVTCKNIIIRDVTNAYGVSYNAGVSNGTRNLSNWVFYQNRFEGPTMTSASYVFCLANLSNPRFERNVFYKNTKTLGFFGTMNGGSSSYFTFKENIFYECTPASMFKMGDTGTSDPRVNSSILFDNNQFINCTSTDVINLNRWKSGLTLKVVNNRFTGTTKSGIKANAEIGYTGQSIFINHNYFGPSMTSILTNGSESVADCSYNYHASGITASQYVGDVISSPYYVDAAMTILEGDASVLAVTAPAGATVKEANQTITYEGVADLNTVEFNLQVSEGATYKLYSDSRCTEEIDNNTVTLAGMNTTAYVKVTAGDGRTYKVYTIQINKPINSKAELLGVAEKGSIKLQDTLNCTIQLPNRAVNANLTPVVSSGASANVYVDSNLKTPLRSIGKVAIPVGKTTYYIKVVSEDGKATNVYTVAFTRKMSDEANLVAVKGALDEAEINGSDVTVYYANTTKSALPIVEVSAGASYKLYRGVGHNLEITSAVNLAVGDNLIYVAVIAEDGETVQDYVLHMIRMDKSAENYLTKDTFPRFAWDEASMTGEQIGTKKISNFTQTPYVELKLNAYTETLEDTIAVSEAASYSVFKNYNKETNEPSGILCNNNETFKLSLKEGTNIFYIRVTAENNETRYIELRVINQVKNTEGMLYQVKDFSGQLKGNVYTASSIVDNAPVILLLSQNATATFYADRKKTIKLPSTMSTYTDADTHVAYASCTLDAPMAQPYIKIYADVTSQAGKTTSYELRLTAGSFNLKFEDVSEKFWGKPYIDEAYQLGITQGYTNKDGVTTFSPNAYSTREEIAVFICNFLGIDASAYSNAKMPYKDASKIAKWSSNAVKAVTALGYMNGSSGNFNPKNNITREEFMAVMVRAASLDTSKASSSILNSFKDSSNVSSWAKVYARTAVYYKLVNGANGKLNPKNNITRAEIAKIMVCAKDFVR